MTAFGVVPSNPLHKIAAYPNWLFFTRQRGKLTGR